MTGPELVRGLREQRHRRLEQVAALARAYEGMVSASEDSNADDEHDPEGATIAFERSQLAAQLAHARAGVTELDGALARAAAGSYGRCERCGGPIAAARLEARPAARTCIACARGG